MSGRARILDGRAVTFHPLQRSPMLKEAPVSVAAPSRVHLLKTGLSRECSTAAPTISRPHFNWRTRILLPALLLLGFGGAIAYTARDSLVPPRGVKVVPVMLAPIGSASAESS